LLVYRRSEGASVNTVVMEKSYLAPIWTKAIDEGLVAVNPWQGVKLPGKPTEPVPTFWTVEEVGRIAAACPTERTRDLVVVLLNTGSCPTETC
jgi:hypothetical protein